MKIILIILLSITFLYAVWEYFIKNVGNHFIKTKRIVLNIIVILFSMILIMVLLKVLTSIIICSIILLAILIYMVEFARNENKEMFYSFDGIVRNYEIPIKWINSSILKNGTLYNNFSDDRVRFIDKTIRTLSNKYIYYVHFKNHKKKLVQKGTLMYEKINDKFNEKQ